MAEYKPLHKYVLAYLCTTTHKIVVEQVIAHDAYRAVEALRGQGVTKVGYWHQEDWRSHGKPISDAWERRYWVDAESAARSVC